MILHGDLNSGNCLKVVFIADYLGIKLGIVLVDILGGETRTAKFLAMNAFGQVPVLETEGRYLAQSNAILRHLARGTALLPDDEWLEAKVDEWLFWEQYSHEPNIATCRFHMHYLGKPKEARDPGKVERGERALDLMESHLTDREWLVGDALTIADIALLAYTQVADEGGFDLFDRPHIRAWIARSRQALGRPTLLPMNS
jgi:glutathione S-transferase